MRSLLLLLALAASCATTVEPPYTYECGRAPAEVMIDGLATEWEAAPWTTDFVDIEGDPKPKPWLRTRAKLMWDDEKLYVLAHLEERQLQASFTERDSFIYQEDNNFEVFIDPDGDRYNYFELEVNAFGTPWDLFLAKPYSEDGEADHSFDFEGLELGIVLEGTVNDPSDVDEGWWIEIAIPFADFGEFAGTPEPGDVWRLNFSRVEWRFAVEHDNYVKIVDPEADYAQDGHIEENWVWSPQGVLNLHVPERWGFLRFVR